MKNFLNKVNWKVFFFIVVLSFLAAGTNKSIHTWSDWFILSLSMGISMGLIFGIINKMK